MKFKEGLTKTRFFFIFFKNLTAQAFDSLLPLKLLLLNLLALELKLILEAEDFRLQFSLLGRPCQRFLTLGFKFSGALGVPGLPFFLEDLYFFKERLLQRLDSSSLFIQEERPGIPVLFPPFLFLFKHSEILGKIDGARTFMGIKGRERE